MSTTNGEKSQEDRLNGLFTEQLGFGLTLSGWIALPVIFGFFLGKYLTNKLGWPEYTFYICVVLAVILSFYGLIKESLQYVKTLEIKSKEDKAKKTNNVTNLKELAYKEEEKYYE